MSEASSATAARSGDEMRTELSTALIAAVARSKDVLTSAARADVVAYVKDAQRDDGGFAGRDGESDLYYTVFALNVLPALDEKPYRISALTAYLKSYNNDGALDFVHLVSLIRCRACLRRYDLAAESVDCELLQRVEAFRSADGGYSHISEHAASGTAYAAYLAAQAYADSCSSLPRVQSLAQSLLRLKTVRGAFRNDAESEAGTVTATAAAVVVLKHLRLGTDLFSACGWLLQQAAPDGGFHAGPGAPMPDLLCTATALYALRTAACQVPEKVRDACLDFIADCWHDSGGFCATRADAVPDVEYTFYALLSFGSLRDP